MSKLTRNHVPAPLEYFTDRIMHHFHELRKQHNNDIIIELDGVKLHGGDLGEILNSAKKETYETYKNHLNDKPVLRKNL